MQDDWTRVTVFDGVTVTESDCVYKDGWMTWTIAFEPAADPEPEDRPVSRAIIDEWMRRRP